MRKHFLTPILIHMIVVENHYFTIYVFALQKLSRRLGLRKYCGESDKSSEAGSTTTTESHISLTGEGSQVSKGAHRHSATKRD